MAVELVCCMSILTERINREAIMIATTLMYCKNGVDVYDARRRYAG